ncbi:MAG: hypothetical protein Q9220_006587 [cf. Caloplaca sp. 1 TL-2023]
MEQASKDEAAQQRIIGHMNADHQDSLIRYLEHFCHLSSFRARNAKLDNVTLDSLTISTGQSKSYLVPIHPAMTSWTEARTRFAALDGEANKALGRSDITIKEYTRPRGFSAVVFVIACINFVAFSTRSNFHPGSLLYDNVLRHAKGFANFCSIIQPALITFMVVVHSIEVVYMGLGRMKKHSVPTFSKLWWQWMLDTSIEGVFAFMRFDGLVKKAEEKKANANH